MDEHIGIATNGTGKVRVEWKRQAIVADVIGAVLRLGHGANRHGFDHIFSRVTRCCLEQLPQRRLGVGGINLRHFETELGNKLPQLLQLLGIRPIVNPVHRCAG